MARMVSLTRRAREAAEAMLSKVLDEEPATAEELAKSLDSSEVAALSGAPVSTYDVVFDEDGMLRTGEPTVFLWRKTPAYGHWCAAWCRRPETRPDILSVFDSYGERVPDSWERDPETADELGQERARILDAVADGRWGEMEWHDYPMQQKGRHIATCGRWAALRLGLSHLTPREFATSVYAASRAIESTPDDLVVRLTRYAL